MTCDSDADQIRSLLDGIHHRYGFDFRDYAPASIKRRIFNVVRAEKLPSVEALEERVLRNTDCMERFLLALSVHTTSMFRDPGFFEAFREKVVCHLRTYPFVRIWHAGCSTGEEVYSLAILLREAGLEGRCRIYATDISEAVLAKAKAGIYPLAAMQEYTRNYIAAGGPRAFSDYYTACYGNAVLQASLRDNIVFAQHNLVTDRSFNEFQVVLCRNVMIYFNRSLQSRVHQLLRDSLCPFGFLALGTKESLEFTPLAAQFEELDGRYRIYRRRERPCARS